MIGVSGGNLSIGDFRKKLKHREGFRREVYPDAQGRRAFGFGELVREDEEEKAQEKVRARL